MRAIRNCCGQAILGFGHGHLDVVLQRIEQGVGLGRHNLFGNLVVENLAVFAAEIVRPIVQREVATSAGFVGRDVNVQRRLRAVGNLRAVCVHLFQLELIAVRQSVGNGQRLGHGNPQRGTDFAVCRRDSGRGFQRNGSRLTGIIAHVVTIRSDFLHFIVGSGEDVADGRGFARLQGDHSFGCN